MATVVLLLALTLSGAVEQKPGGVETVPASALKSTERSVRQARADWLAASSRLEEDLLIRNAKEMRTRIGRARTAKERELDAVGRMFRTLVASFDRSHLWLETDLDVVPSLNVEGVRTTVAEREAELRAQIDKLGPDSLVLRETLKVQAERLKELRTSLEQQREAADALAGLDDERREAETALRERVASLHSRLTQLADSAGHEQALWDRYYDALEDAVDAAAEKAKPKTRPAPFQE